MSNVVPMRPSLAAHPPIALPNSIEVEQALIGSVLLNSALAERCPWLSPADFYEPVHGRIWQAAQEAARQGRRVDARLLKRAFDADAALADLDGGEYLIRLAHCADTITNALDYARYVKKLARRRELIAIADEIRERALDPAGDEDPAEVVAMFSDRLGRVALDESRPLAKHISQVIDEIVADIDHPPQRWRIGLSLLDTSIGGRTEDHLGGGIPEGYVLGIEARMKSFKSGLCHTALLSLALQGIPCCYFALEMGSVRLARRMLAQKGQFMPRLFHRGGAKLKEMVSKARERLDVAPLYFEDQPGMRFSTLRAKANQIMQAHGVKVFVLDYWQLVQPDGKITSKADFLAEVAQWCADHAHKHGTTWFIASQENRTGESYGSDGLAKACDWLAVLHKHEVKMHLHPFEEPVETLWVEVKHSRDGMGGDLGAEDKPTFFISPLGPYLEQLPGVAL